MDGFVFFKALGLESNCLKETFKSLLVSFKNRDSADSPMLAVFLPLTVFDFLEFPWDTVCLVHTASSCCGGSLVRGCFVSPWSLEIMLIKLGLGKGYQRERGRWVFYRRWWTGWTQFYVGFYGDRWGGDQARWLWSRKVYWQQTVGELENSLMGSRVKFWTEWAVLPSWDFSTRQTRTRYVWTEWMVRFVRNSRREINNYIKWR